MTSVILFLVDCVQNNSSKWSPFDKKTSQNGILFGNVITIWSNSSGKGTVSPLLMQLWTPRNLPALCELFSDLLGADCTVSAT